MNQEKRVVIVGGGPGGLCTAMLLSAKGFDVTLLEKQSSLGGRTGSLVLGDYTFDLGSTMVMMRFVFDEMFALAGRRLEDEVKLTRLEPMYRLNFDGRALDVFSDADQMKAELERFSPGSEAGLAQFLQRERNRLEHLYPVLQRSYPNLASLLAPPVFAALPHVGLGQSLHDTARSYFADEALQLAFSFQAAYLGMSPWECPGGFGMVPYVEHAWGIDHVQGGIHRVCEAMARIAREHGARIRTGVAVKRILVDGDRATGVELTTGERIECNDVVINADATAALQQLLEGDVSTRFRRAHLEHTRESCSTFMLYLGLDLQLPLAHHTFFFARDYRAEMNRLFKTGELGDDLSLYVCNPARTDPTMAPPGHSAVYVLALTPNTRAAIDWETEAPHMRAKVLAELGRRTGCAIEPHIRAESLLTPHQWETRFEISHGAVFGPTHNIGQLLSFRLPNQLPAPRHVYLTGGGTNPGSGLPTILESARIAARLVCERHGLPFPASLPLPATEQLRAGE